MRFEYTWMKLSMKYPSPVTRPNDIRFIFPKTKSNNGYSACRTQNRRVVR